MQAQLQPLWFGRLSGLTSCLLVLTTLFNGLYAQKVYPVVFKVFDLDQATPLPNQTPGSVKNFPNAPLAREIEITPTKPEEASADGTPGTTYKISITPESQGYPTQPRTGKVSTIRLKDSVSQKKPAIKKEEPPKGKKQKKAKSEKRKKKDKQSKDQADTPAPSASQATPTEPQCDIRLNHSPGHIFDWQRNLQRSVTVRSMQGYDNYYFLTTDAYPDYLLDNTERKLPLPPDDFFDQIMTLEGQLGRDHWSKTDSIEIALHYFQQRWNERLFDVIFFIDCRWQIDAVIVSDPYSPSQSMIVGYHLQFAGDDATFAWGSTSNNAPQNLFIQVQLDNPPLQLVPLVQGPITQAQAPQASAPITIHQPQSHSSQSPQSSQGHSNRPRSLPQRSRAVSSLTGEQQTPPPLPAKTRSRSSSYAAGSVSPMGLHGIPLPGTTSNSMTTSHSPVTGQIPAGSAYSPPTTPPNPPPSLESPSNLQPALFTMDEDEETPSTGASGLDGSTGQSTMPSSPAPPQRSYRPVPPPKVEDINALSRADRLKIEALSAGYPRRQKNYEEHRKDFQQQKAAWEQEFRTRKPGRTPSSDSAANSIENDPPWNCRDGACNLNSNNNNGNRNDSASGGGGSGHGTAGATIMLSDPWKSIAY